MARDRIVLCMKWGPVFPADYVNVLYRACRTHLTGGFRFVCLSDDLNGFDDGVEALHIPDIGLTPDEWYTRGVWPKLALYGADLHGLSGRGLFIDLDMMVVGSLDAMFANTDPFVALDVGENWRKGADRTRPPEVGTGVFAFDIGQQPQILAAFKSDKKAAMENYVNEQSFVQGHVSAVSYWPAEWVISFKRHLRQPLGIDLFKRPLRPPSSAKIVAFHGNPRPIDLVADSAGYWDVFPHMGRGQVDWVRDYWVEYGGDPNVATRGNS